MHHTAAACPLAQLRACFLHACGPGAHTTHCQSEGCAWSPEPSLPVHAACHSHHPIPTMHCRTHSRVAKSSDTRAPGRARSRRTAARRRACRTPAARAPSAACPAARRRPGDAAAAAGAAAAAPRSQMRPPAAAACSRAGRRARRGRPWPGGAAHAQQVARAQRLRARALCSRSPPGSTRRTLGLGEHVSSAASVHDPCATGSVCAAAVAALARWPPLQHPGRPRARRRQPGRARCLRRPPTCGESVGGHALRAPRPCHGLRTSKVK